MTACASCTPSFAGAAARSLPSKTETLARWIVRDLRSCTGNRLQHRVPVGTIAARLALNDRVPIEDALQHAVDQGWVIVEGGQRVRLTDDGRL